MVLCGCCEASIKCSRGVGVGVLCEGTERSREESEVGHSLYIKFN